MIDLSRPPVRTRGLKQLMAFSIARGVVASSREDAWIETLIEELEKLEVMSRPRARTRGLKLP